MPQLAASSVTSGAAFLPHAARKGLRVRTDMVAIFCDEVGRGVVRASGSNVSPLASVTHRLLRLKLARLLCHCSVGYDSMNTLWESKSEKRQR